MKTALDGSEPLASLMQRLRASQKCLEAVRSVLPAGLALHVQAGPLDDEGWTLLVANAAVSSKLRQLQPRLMEALLQKGLKVNAIRLRVQTP
ncbi:DciA family protein [Aquabacterium soli]|uniref:DciA family protein n=1 Tax=Aquabacterium soli TaxID=2493092 RepID=UPI001F3F2036|nr:DciA family protein [Aquabacterium soli]